MAKYLQWPTTPQKDTPIMVQFHLWPNQIDKFWDLLYSARMASSNPAHPAQDLVEYKPIVAAGNDLGAN